MEESLDHVVYSKNVVEFATVAGEYCAFLEKIKKYKRTNFVDKTQKVLALLYLKALMLPATNDDEEGFAEAFVTELEWTTIQENVAEMLGQHDVFFFVSDAVTQQSADAANVCVSECLADIYQDLKNFVGAYRLGSVETMNVALASCKANFEQYWGLRLLGTLDTLHKLAFGAEPITDDDDTKNKKKADTKPRRNTDNWFITRRQNEWNDDEHKRLLDE